MGDTKIEISPETIRFEAVRFGALNRVISDWVKEKGLEYDGDAIVILSSLWLLSSSLPEDSGISNEVLSAMVLDLHQNRKIELEGGFSFVFPKWEESIPPFDRQMCDFALFTIHTCLGFRYGYDSIEQSALIYPYRPLILLSIKEGFDTNDEDSRYHYQKMREYFLLDDGTVEFYHAICAAIAQ